MRIWFVSILMSLITQGYSSILFANVNQLKSLIIEKEFESAYQLAQTKIASDAGDSEFDFLLGVAALETNHLPEAIFALERVTMAHPDNARSWFELGRAYYKLRQYDLAQQTFQMVLVGSPGDSLKNWTQHYLELIESGKKFQKPLQGLLHASLAPGYSSNINTGPDLEFIRIPVSNGERWGEVPPKVPDGFIHGDVFGELRYRWNDRAMLRTKLWANYRKNFQSKNYDYQSIGVDANVDFVKQKWQFGVPLHANLLFINYERFRWIFDGGGSVGYNINPKNRLIFSGIFDFNYFPFDPSLNATNLRVNLEWESWWKNFHFLLDAYGNWVFPLFKEQAYLSKDFYGAKMVGIYHIGLKHQIIGALMGERSIYKDVNLSYEVERADWLLNAFFAWRWNFASEFSIQPSYSLVKTFSNVIEYEHMRHEFQFAISWDFLL